MVKKNNGKRINPPATSKRTGQLVRTPKKSRKQKKPNSRPRSTANSFSNCARDYLVTLENPFSGRTACVPSLFNFPSMKHSVTAYGQFNTGSAGVGWVSLAPLRTQYNGTTKTAPTGSIYWTGAGYAGTGFNNLAVGTYHSNTDTPYFCTNTDAHNAVATRIVACGLRVRNITPMLNRGGSIIGLETLNHQGLTEYGYTSSTAMLQDTAAPMSSTSDEWQSVVYHPQQEDELTWFSGYDAYYNTILARDTLGFIATAPSATPQVYEWQVITAFEAKGDLVQGLKSSVSDPQGFAIVQNLSSSTEGRRPKEGDRGAWVAGMLGRAVAYGAAALSGYQAARRPPPVMPQYRHGPLIEEMYD